MTYEKSWETTPFKIFSQQNRRYLLSGELISGVHVKTPYGGFTLRDHCMGNFKIKEEYRGKGYARKLFRNVKRLSVYFGFGYIQFSSLKELKPMYEKFGATVVKEEYDEYDDKCIVTYRVSTPNKVNITERKERVQKNFEFTSSFKVFKELKMTQSYFKAVQVSFPDLVLAEVYKEEETETVLVTNEFFFFGTLEYRLKRAHKWADNLIKILKKYETAKEYI